MIDTETIKQRLKKEDRLLLIQGIAVGAITFIAGAVAGGSAFLDTLGRLSCR